MADDCGTPSTQCTTVLRTPGTGLAPIMYSDTSIHHSWHDLNGLNNASQNAQLESGLKTMVAANQDVLLDPLFTPQQFMQCEKEIEKYLTSLQQPVSEAMMTEHSTTNITRYTVQQTKTQEQELLPLRGLLQAPSAKIQLQENSKPCTPLQQPQKPQLPSNDQQLQASLLQLLLRSQQLNQLQTDVLHQQQVNVSTNTQNNQIQELIKGLAMPKCTPQQQQTVNTSPTTTSAPSVLTPQPSIDCPMIELKATPDGKPFISIPTILLNKSDPMDVGDAVIKSEHGSKRIRKLPHIQIEKKYRDSISTRMNDLKELLFEPNDKPSKARILEKALRDLRRLKNENMKLRDENEALKRTQQQRDAVVQLLNLQKRTQMVCNQEMQVPNTKCDPSADEKQTNSSQAFSPGHEQKMKEQTNGDTFESLPCGPSLALKDRSRVALCSFLIIFLFFSPLNFFLPISQTASLFSSTNNDFSRPHSGSRTLTSADDPAFLPSSVISWALIFSIKWLVNVLVVVGVLVHIFLFGEPITRPHSPRAVLFWRHKTQADIDRKRGAHASAAEHLETCLSILGRPFPKSRLDMMYSLLWHYLRHVFYRLGIERRLASAAFRLLFRQVNQDVIKEYDRINARDASQVCLALLQLSLTGQVRRGFWQSTILSLSSINYAETAGSFIDARVKAKMYVTAAIQIRQMLPQRLQFISRYFLLRARDTCAADGTPIPHDMQWLFQPQGHRFFVSSKWSCQGGGRMWASSGTSYVDPVATLYQEFKEHLFHEALKATLFPRDIPNLNDQAGKGPTSSWADAMYYCEALAGYADSVTVTGAPGQASIGGDSGSSCALGASVRKLQGSGGTLIDYPWCGRSGDEVAKWWAAVGMVAINWLQGEDEAAEKLYSAVESVPKTLWHAEDPIAKALFQAFKARRKVIHNKSLNKEKVSQCQHLCNKSSRLLRESIKLASYQNMSMVTDDTESTSMASSTLRKLVQLLCCDWLMATRTDIWEGSRSMKMLDRTIPKGSTGLSAFQYDLESLQKLAQDMDAALPRMYLYEAMFRLMTGANPTHTHQLLQRTAALTGKPDNGYNSKHKASLQPGVTSEECVTGERERAIALLTACRYLPKPFLSAPGQRREMLVDAASCLERIGDKRTLHCCKRLLLQLSDET